MELSKGGQFAMRAKLTVFFCFVGFTTHAATPSTKWLSFNEILNLASLLHTIQGAVVNPLLQCLRPLQNSRSHSY